MSSGANADIAAGLSLATRRRPLALRRGHSLDPRMQSPDCGLAALHSNKQIYRMRGQNIFVDADSVRLQNLNCLKCRRTPRPIAKLMEQFIHRENLAHHRPAPTVVEVIGG